MGLTNISVRTGDALDASSVSDPEDTSIDMIITETYGPGLFDEKALQISSRFSKFLSPTGETIPRATTIRATLMPVNKGVSFEGGVRRGLYDKIMLNVDGTDLPVIPDDDWSIVEQGTIDMKDAAKIKKISGSIPLPKGISLEKFNMNYLLLICIELQLSTQTLAQYQTFCTFPIRLDFIRVPPELKDKNPEDLEVRYEFEPGSDSASTVQRAWLVEKSKA